MTALHHSILGLPRSGKTTFLAALWHVIDAGEVKTKLVLDKMIGDLEYLEKIVGAWRRCEEVPRTSSANEATVEIYAKTVSENRSFVLSFPDLSGESFEQQFASRSCRQDYVEGFDKAGGILLFINAERKTQGHTHADMQPLGPVQAPMAGLAEGATATPAKAPEWTAKVVPEQVQLVDLLQFLQMRPFERRPRRIAIVISAWDVVPEPRPSPETWLTQELPLLAQFLGNNPDSFLPRIYGLSAQGGDVTGEERTKLAQHVPSRRIQCEGLDVEPHDLTAPLFWLNECE